MWDIVKKAVHDTPVRRAIHRTTFELPFNYRSDLGGRRQLDSKIPQSPFTVAGARTRHYHFMARQRQAVRRGIPACSPRLPVRGMAAQSRICSPLSVVRSAIDM